MGSLPFLALGCARFSGVAVHIKPTRYGSATAQKLIAELMADLEERYGDVDRTPVDGFEFDPPDGGFLVAYLDGQPVGCGAWRSHARSADVAEVKRVFVQAQARKQGLARSIMAALEEHARAHGRKRIILETGTAQPEAIALYQALGYERITNFGYYKDEPGARCFAKTL
jgi:GNAT superfamily N-acetyltransferase